MTALQIMSSRQTKIDWQKIELDWIKLPQLFKAFHDNFDISTIGNYWNFAYSKDGRIETFGFYKHPLIQNLILDTIYEIEELRSRAIDFVEYEKANENDPLAEDVIPLAYDPNGALLMLGVGDANADKIYYYVRHWDEKLKLLADNIFEFFKDYHIEIDEFYLTGMPLDSLYKNWNDKFWRVRET